MSARWDDLRIFLAVARSGTLTSAATSLDVNPSTVHRRIAGLEEDLGEPLFLRDPRGYTLTSLGAALLPHAETVETSVLGFDIAARGHDDQARGEVILTMPFSLVALVSGAIAEVKAEHPQLEIIIVDADRIMDLGREVDLAIRPSSDPPQEAVGRKVGRISWGLYGPTDGQATHWVVYSAGGPVLPRKWQEANRNLPVGAELSSVGSMLEVLEGANRAGQKWCGLLPTFFGEVSPTLARVGGVIEEASTDLWLLLHADLRRSARVQVLVERLDPLLREVFG